MATIRKHGNKWQVQVRRAGSPPVSRSFTLKADAEVWARQTEVQADKRAIPADARMLDRTTVLQLMQRYQESVIPQKRCAKIEADMMAAMMKCSWSRLTLSAVSAATFNTYRDDRLKTVKPSTLCREFSILQHMFNLAIRDWGVPLQSNPFANVRRPRITGARERRVEGQEEMARLLAAAEQCNNPYIYPIMLFAIETGKGHIHEYMLSDAKNVKNILSGNRTVLTNSTTAETVDLVTMSGRRVAERLQAKDVLSSSGIAKIRDQVAAGKFRSAQLVGTKETTQLVNPVLEKAGLAKEMSSSGISSKSTTSLAQRAGATGAGTLSEAAMTAAKSGGTVGAVVGAGIEVVTGVIDLIDGKRDFGDVALSTVKGAAKGYASGAAAGAVATTTGAVVSSGLALGGVATGTLAASAATFALPLVAAVGAGYLICEAFDWIFD